MIYRFAVKPEWEDNRNYDAYHRRLLELLTAEPKHLDHGSGECDAGVSCAWMPVDTCHSGEKYYLTGTKESTQSDTLRAYVSSEKCKDFVASNQSGCFYGWGKKKNDCGCVNMNDVYCGSLDWVTMFTQRKALPWMTSNASAVEVQGVSWNGIAIDLYVPLITRDLESECAESFIEKLRKFIIKLQQPGVETFLSDAITEIIHIVDSTSKAKVTQEAIDRALGLFQALLCAYEPAKMDVYSCSTKALIESRGADSGGALGWIGNVRKELSVLLTNLTGGVVKNIDQLSRDVIKRAWESAFPNVGTGKKSVLLHYFETATEKAVQRMINQLVGPGPDFTLNDGDDCWQHFQLSNQICSLGVQQTTDTDILNAATAWLQSVCHHDGPPPPTIPPKPPCTSPPHRPYV